LLIIALPAVALSLKLVTPPLLFAAAAPWFVIVAAPAVEVLRK
jgi:hypothetical protein